MTTDLQWGLAAQKVWVHSFVAVVQNTQRMEQVVAGHILSAVRNKGKSMLSTFPPFIRTLAHEVVRFTLSMGLPRNALIKSPGCVCPRSPQTQPCLWWRLAITVDYMLLHKHSKCTAVLIFQIKKSEPRKQRFSEFIKVVDRTTQTGA